MVNKLQIVRLDNLAVQRVDLQIGDNIIGRGAATGNVDNPIAEHAVTINLEPTGEMTMTPMLPCYIKCSSSPRWQSLKIGSIVAIKPGDICSLLPEKSWFKVTSNNSVTTMDDNDVNNGKRKTTNSSEDEPPDKKLRASSSVETIYSRIKDVSYDRDTVDVASTIVDRETNNPISQCSQSNNATSGSKDEHTSSSEKQVQQSNDQDSIAETRENNVTNIPLSNDPPSSGSNDTGADSSLVDLQRQQNRDDPGKRIKWDCARHFSDQTDQVNETTVEETPAAGNSTSGETNNDPSVETTRATSNEPPMRNKCVYGSQCYRQNADHKRELSHPGDADYEMPDPRPECPYGVRCYRKNPQHKRDFKHTRVRPSRAQTPIRGGRMSDVASYNEQSSADDESVDESDYEPSYNGATSDETYSDFDGLSDFDGISDNDEK